MCNALKVAGISESHPVDYVKWHKQLHLTTRFFAWNVHFNQQVLKIFGDFSTSREQNGLLKL